MSQCDAIIVNFNAGEFLKDSVKSVLQSPSLARVFVVDNASTDSSLDAFAQDRDDRVTVIRNSTNLGFAAACNIGLARTTCDYVLFLNPDARVAEGAIERLIAALQAARHAGMAGPLLLNSDGSEQAGGRRMFPTPRIVVARALGSKGFGRHISANAVPPHQQPLPQGPSEVEAISGACMMVRRAAILDVGPLDEQYFLHCEDLDWCFRFHKHGWTILFVPQATVTHLKGVSSVDRPITIEYYKHKGMIRLYRKDLCDGYPGWLMSLVILGVWTRFAAVAARHLLFRNG